VVGSCVNIFRTQWLTVLMRLVSLPGDGIIIPILLVVILAVLFYRKDKTFAYVLAIAPLVGEIIKSLLKNYYREPRPAFFGCSVLTKYMDQFSFPSGHTIFYTIFFGLIAYYCVKHFNDFWVKIGLVVAIFLISTIGYSRVYLGAHWPIDVVGGYIIGGAILTIAIFAYEFYGKEKKNV